MNINDLDSMIIELSDAQAELVSGGDMHDVVGYVPQGQAKKYPCMCGEMAMIPADYPAALKPNQQNPNWVPAHYEH